MRRGRWIASAAAAAMLLSLAAGGNVPAANIRIIGESEEQTETPALTLDGQAGEEAAAVRETESEAEAPDPGKPLNPAADNITAQDAVEGARTLYSQMQHYADINDNENFAALFEKGTDAQTVQDQLQTIKSALAEMDGLDTHCDLCFFDPTKDTTQSPYYFAVALCDYDVDPDGAVAWYSTLMRTAKYADGWKISVMSAGDMLAQQFPQGYRDALGSGRNAADLYPSLAMRFTEGAVFDGALYALPCMIWQQEDGSVCCAVWLANGTGTAKWCDTIDLIIKDEKLKTITSVNVPVQQALEGGDSSLVTCTVPADHVETGKQEWTGISVNSNLRYQ